MSLQIFLGKQICRLEGGPRFADAGCVRVDLLFFPFFSEGNRPHASDIFLTFFCVPDEMLTCLFLFLM